MATETSSSTPSKLREQLIGAWEMVSYIAFKLSDPLVKFYPMTKECQGIIMFSPNGYFSAQVMQPGAPPYAKGDAEGFRGATVEEFAAMARNYNAYAGPFELSEKLGEKPSFTTSVLMSTFPNWINGKEKRMIHMEEIDGQLYMTLQPAEPLMLQGEKIMAELRWRKPL